MAAKPTASDPDAKPASPRQLIVKFKSDAAHGVSECTERWLAEGRSFKHATADHSDSLDDVRAQTGTLRAHAFLKFRTGLSTKAAQAKYAERTARVRARLATRAASAAAPDAPAASPPDLTNVYVLDLEDGVDVQRAAQRYARDPHVEYAQPNYAVRASFVPNDPYYSSSGSWGQSGDDLWNLKKIGAAAAWDRSQGQGVVVAVVDTGLDISHPEITGNVWSNADETPGNHVDDDGNGYVDDSIGWNFVNDTIDPTDDHGHGTHVAGIIAAIGDNGSGIVGVAPRARIMPLKALDAAGNGTTDNLARAILYAAHHNAAVINNSWGCDPACPTNPVIEEAVRTAHALRSVVVFAAGNESGNVADWSPQNQPQPIVVGASDVNDQLSSFSNYGFVDVVAPGGGPAVAPPAYEPARNILSLKSGVCTFPAELTVGNGLLRQAGTSMAAPHVSGLAALIVSQNPSYLPEEVRQVLRHSSVDLGVAGNDQSFGYGRIAADRALVEPHPPTVLITAPSAVSTSASVVEVRGTAAGFGFAAWGLSVGLGTPPSQWTSLGSAMTAVTDGLFATWDANHAADGVYTLRLEVLNQNGQLYEDRQRVVLDRVQITAPVAEPLAFYAAGQTINIEGSAAPGNLSSYTLAVFDDYGQFPAEISLTHGGTQRIDSGVLGTWNTTGVPAGKYRIVLTAYLTDGSSLSESVNVVIDPTIHAGWPLRLTGGYTLDGLAAADINGDGKAELLLGFGHDMRVYDHTGASLPGWPRTVDPNGVGAFTFKVPAVGDITGDGVVEIVGTNSAGDILVWQPNGNPLAGWPRSFGSSRHSVAIADVNGDGVQEIVATDMDGHVKVINANGALLPGWPVTLEGGAVLMPPAVADLNLDGNQEIVVAPYDAPTNLYVLSATGAVLPGWPKAINAGQTGQQQFSYPALGDLDGDGDVEIVMGAMNGTVHAFHHDGTIVAGWPQATRPVLAHSPTLGDVDRDGRLEVVVGAAEYGTPHHNYIFAWHGDGTLLPSYPLVITPSAGITGTGGGASALVDADGDGRPDFLHSQDDLQLAGHRLDGTVVPGFPKLTEGTATTYAVTPAAADFDGDGKLEVAWIDMEDAFTHSLYLWDLPSSAAAPAPWPMFQHDARLSGAASLPLTAVADAHVADGWSASTNYGTATVMELRTGSWGLNRDAYLRFDARGAGAQVSHAKLRFSSAYGGSGSAAVNVYTSTNTSWAETAITWNTKPARSAALLGTATVSGGSFHSYEVDVTAWVNGELAAGRTLLTFVLHNPLATTAAAQVQSRESSGAKPTLLINP